MNKETIEYLKEINRNRFGYEQDKIISFNDAQEIVEHLEAFENRKIELEKENKQLKEEKEKLLKSMLKAHLDLKKDGEYSEFKAGGIAMLTSIMEEIKKIENGVNNE